MALIKIVIGDNPSSGIDKHKSSQVKSRPKKKKWKKITVASMAAMILISTVVTVGWHIAKDTASNANPFTTTLMASIKYPLYHPTFMPTSYQVDKRSVQEPTTGVVTFDLTNSKGQKIYFSEEARPANYNIGGFFKKFTDLKEYALNGGGTIAVGMVDNNKTQIGSMTNNQVWIIADTNDLSVSQSQLTTMLKELSSNVN